MTYMEDYLNQQFEHPLSGPGVMAVRDMTIRDLTTVIRVQERRVPRQPFTIKRLRAYRAALSRYEKLYGAHVIVDIPVFAFERASRLNVDRRRPFARVK